MKVNAIKDLIALTGMENMRRDLFYLNEAIKNDSEDLTLRFYSWSPKCVSLGKSQKELKLGVNIDTVQRPTGGRALLHDNELTYSVIMKAQNKSIMDSYKDISDAIIKGFWQLGIELHYAGESGKNMKYCMNISSGADVCYKNKKLIGSAQFRKRGYLLQHGSILMDADFDFIEKVFLEPIGRDSITTLKKINPNITKQDLIEAIEYGFKEKFEH